MATNASAGFITALKATLADGTAGWAVKSVTETSATRVASVSGSVSGSTSGGGGGGTITGGEGSVSLGSVSGSVSGSTSSTATTRVTTTVTLEAANKRLASSAVTPMRFSYAALKDDGSFSSAVIRIDGAELTTTDSALNTTINTLVATFQAAKDTALTTAFGVASVTSSADPLAVPTDLLTAVKASLANADHDWLVQGRSEQLLPRPPTVTTGDGRPQTRKHITVSLISRVTRVATTDGSIGAIVSGVVIPAGSQIPGTVTYMAQIDEEGALAEAQIMVGASLWRTTDSALHSQIIALGDTFLSARHSSIVTALT